MRCPLCGDPVRPGQPVAVMKRLDDRARIVHADCGALALLARVICDRALLDLTEELGTLPSPN